MDFFRRIGTFQGVTLTPNAISPFFLSWPVRSIEERATNVICAGAVAGRAPRPRYGRAVDSILIEGVLPLFPNFSRDRRKNLGRRAGHSLMARGFRVEASIPGAGCELRFFWGRKQSCEPRNRQCCRTSPAADASAAGPLESRGGSPPPERQPPVPAASAPEPPSNDEKADDLEAIKKAVDDAASVGGGSGSPICSFCSISRSPRAR